MTRAFARCGRDALVTQYFELLKQTNSLRTYLERARAQAWPRILPISASAARLFYYWQQQGNPAAAERVLAEFRQRKDARRSRLDRRRIADAGAAVRRRRTTTTKRRATTMRCTALAGNDNAMAETALAVAGSTAASAPEQAIHFGSGNLSLYRDVATMDPHPGFLNGVLSLLLNETDPPERDASKSRTPRPYFRRARAAELVALFESRFPNSPRAPELRERVIEAYRDLRIKRRRDSRGHEVPGRFPGCTESHRGCVAHGRRLRANESDAAGIRDLRRAAGGTGPAGRSGVPLGALAQTAPGVRGGSADAAAESNVRSPDYARVLDRYVARLVSLKRSATR